MYIRDNLWSFNTRDLMRASSCSHCTQLAVARTLGIPTVLAKLQPFMDEPEDTTLAQKYGNIFEQALMDELRASVPEESVGSPEAEGNVEQTIALMNAGVPIIYQGGLERIFDRTVFRGKPDFLIREDWRLEFVDNKLTAIQDADFVSEGTYKYLVFDAKYGGNAKPAYLLQVGLYVDALDALGLKADGGRHGLVLGSRRVETFEEIEIVPAMRLARKKIAEVIASAESAISAGDLTKYDASNLDWHCPSKQNCDICEYPKLCKEDRISTDSLVRVANITQNQIGRLASVVITTMSALAVATDDMRQPRMTEETFRKIRRQAKLQVKADTSGKPEHELLDDPAIAYLPKRSELDIFFDFEGFPYFTERGGLEYLFGNYVWGDGENEGEAKYELFTEFWAHTRDQEKEAFSKFMEWALDRLRRDDKAHIYHYAAYEVSALKRLANRHGCYEQEVDWLIHNNKLIDMYEIVRNSLVIGDESYSIKKLEPHYGFVRDGDVQKGDVSIEEYDKWRELDQLRNDPAISPEDLAKVSAEADKIYEDLRFYNLQDVWSTRELYRWLESLPGASSKEGERESKDDEYEGKSAKAMEALALLEEQTQELFDKVADHEWGLNDEADYRAQIWLALTHSILFYQREDVMFWADLAMKVSLQDELLEAERSGGLIRNVVEIGREQKERQDGTVYQEITYQAELDPDDLFSPSDNLELAVRYVGKGKKHKRDFGRIKEVSGSQVVFTRQTNPKSINYPPSALIDALHIPTTSKQAALLKLAMAIAEDWGSPAKPAPEGPAIMDLLMRRPPKLKTLSALPVADPQDYLPAVSAAIKDLDNSVLAIQGPPGSGKTFLASRTIVDLVSAGKKVGVVANSHSAVENLLEACIEAGVDPELIVKVQREGETDRPWQVKKSPGPVGTFMKNATGGYIVGGTNFFFCNKAITDYKLDYLFIDEAAQFSLVDCMAVSAMADNLVLMGDPLQLPQVVLAIHPGGVENSALGHYMGENSILPKKMGYFVEVTRRLHPKVNHAVSWLAYEGKLRSHEVTVKNKIDGHEQGLIQVAVPHQGNSTSSAEEASEVLRLVRSLYREGDSGSVLVVAAYNAQVDLLRQTLDEAGYTEDKVMVGTVDKFQGREGMAVIYSFAASSSMDAPRGLEFLLDRNRLNVAISRAKATCYLVYSESLLESQFKSVGEVKAVSRLAGLLELGKESPDSTPQQ